MKRGLRFTTVVQLLIHIQHISALTDDSPMSQSYTRHGPLRHSIIHRNIKSSDMQSTSRRVLCFEERTKESRKVKQNSFGRLHVIGVHNDVII